MGSVTEWKVVVGLSYEDAETLMNSTEDFNGDVYDFMEDTLYPYNPDKYSTLNCGYDSEVDVFGIELVGAEEYALKVDLYSYASESKILQGKLNTKFNTHLFKVYIGTNTY